jgi:CHAT domain-containing protein/tetratricopeptide (TPR) repeat protein
MPPKIIRRCLLVIICICLGFAGSLWLSNSTIELVVAQQPPSNSVSLEARGMELYHQRQLKSAIESWQQAAQSYASLKDILAQSRVWSNIALAYGELGDWKRAKNAIESSFQSIELNKGLARDREYQRTLAQISNNRGILELSLGNGENAITLWQQAASYYQQVGDELGILRTIINQTNAFKQLGFDRRAYKNWQENEALLFKQPDSTIKTAGLRSYGDILRLVGQIDRAKQLVEASLTIATKLDAPLEKVRTLLALGSIRQTNGDILSALEAYQQGLKICQQAAMCVPTNLSLQINLAQLNLILKTPSWRKARHLIPEIKAELIDLPINRTNLEYRLAFAADSIELKQKERLESSWQEIEKLLVDIINKAQIIEDRRSQSYALGLQGKIYEHLEQWETATEKTQQALTLSQSLNAAEISYLWQWQLGRIARAQLDRTTAINYYSQAVASLHSLSQDLVAIDRNLQYSFRDSIEPVYRDLVELLLTSESGKSVSQHNLKLARNTLESLQLAELNNFFREACLDAKSIQIDRLDPTAAVIYPIILPNRLELILSLPGKPLRHYYRSIERANLEAIIANFRRSIVIRSRRRFYAPAQKLYDLLIAPVIQDLADNQIKTLVFVPDGLLRNIPLSALHDGKQFLIEKYNVALTPGLQLLAPVSLQNFNLKTIAVGLSKQRQGFTALEYVPKELQEIKNKVTSKILLDRQFTTQALAKAIEFFDYPIVHIATHGQFSSSLEDTFLLTWDSRIDIEHLNRILQTRTPSQNNAIELLVLSACETATGDKWAALGLAGMAVRAGAKSTLATLWAVNDLATAQLMTEFYQELTVDRATKAQAIRQAQLKLLHHPQYRHPFYWSSYVLLGNWL